MIFNGWTRVHIRIAWGILLAVLVGCSSHFTEAATPKEAVDEYFIEHPITQDPRGIAYLSTHYFSDMAIVLYKAPIPDTLYFGAAWRDGASWYTECCSNGRGGGLGAHESMIDFGQDSVPNNGLVHFGERLDPTVAMIEGSYDGGTVVRVPLQGDYFVLFAPNELALCELRLYDAENVLVQRIDPIGQPLDAPTPGCK